MSIELAILATKDYEHIEDFYEHLERWVLNRGTADSVLVGFFCFEDPVRYN